jgi:hypothetical protein
LVDKPNIDIVVGRTLGLGLGQGKGNVVSEKQMCLIAYKGSYEIMFRRLQKQLQDTELGTGSGTGTVGLHSRRTIGVLHDSNR